MTYPVNRFSNQLALEAVLQDDDLYEVRLDNDSNGRVLYIGQNTTPDAPTDEPSWFIKKLGYDSNNFINRIQLPDDGIGFKYSWDDRASYFS